MDEYGRIIRKDMFRGFTEPQRRQMLLENEQLLQLKRERLAQERGNDNEWAIQSVLSSKSMEDAALQEKYLRDSEKDRHLQILARLRIAILFIKHIADFRKGNNTKRPRRGKIERRIDSAPSEKGFSQTLENLAAKKCLGSKDLLCGNKFLCCG